MFADHPYVHIRQIHIAHESTVDQIRKCEFSRARSSYGLVYAIEGDGEYRFSTGERVTVLSGDMFFVSPECAYTIATSTRFHHYTVNFDIDRDTSALQALDVPHYLLRDENTRPLEKLFKRLADIWKQKGFGYEMQATGVLYDLLFLLYGDYLNRENSRKKRRLQSAREYIERNFDQPVRLEQLAYLSDMSVTNFRREWTKLYAQSPIAYRDSVRLYYAEEYLNLGYYTVSEVAEKCGFDDVGYFIRFFRKKTGMTPGRYVRYGK